MNGRFWRHGAYGWLAMAVAMSANGIHKPTEELLANYNIFEGRLWPVVLATVVAAPFV